MAYAVATNFAFLDFSCDSQGEEGHLRLTHSLRETSEQAKVNRSRPPLPPPYMASASGGMSTPSDRVMRLIAMQQQIDMLSSSIIEIQESLSGVWLGLAAGTRLVFLTSFSLSPDELSLQEQEPTHDLSTNPEPVLASAFPSSPQSDAKPLEAEKETPAVDTKINRPVETVRVKIVSVMGDPTSGDRRQPRRSE
jgi:hypothetical protein